MQSSVSTPPRGMKRSSSVASFPTPPSIRKRGGLSCDSDEDQVPATDEDDGRFFREVEDEESFWLAPNSPYATAIPLLYQRLQAQSQDQVDGPRPVSPPPSCRRSVMNTRNLPRTPTPKSMSSPGSPPRTSLLERRDSKTRSSPLGSDDEVFTASTVSGSQVEKPTIAFVFRGVRLSFLNPYYNASSSTDSNPNSQLPPEHPEFETAERPEVRKLLFG
ncbi:hypothetical protein B0H10DRAFT_2084510 [Mycena sp. CBHHK59/15]|nr:hypothetical protein B0H10DRAFT_2084510 [Mycena sp. CBHHK59/15]